MRLSAPGVPVSSSRADGDLDRVPRLIAELETTDATDRAFRDRPDRSTGSGPSGRGRLGGRRRGQDPAGGLVVGEWVGLGLMPQKKTYLTFSPVATRPSQVGDSAGRDRHDGQSARRARRLYAGFAPFR